jgi:hypothetical protein
MNFKINKIAEAAIKECRDAKINLTDENIITIYELGKAADSTIGTGLRYYNGIKIGSITLYPLTMGARLWLEYEAKELSYIDNTLYDWATLWAFAHANDPSSFEFKDSKHFKNTIKKWGRRIDCTDEELREALLKIGGIIEPTDSKKEKQDVKGRETYSPMLNFLISTYGKDIHHWLWEVNEDLCSAMIKEQGRRNSDKKTTISGDDPNIVAFMRLKIYISQLKAIAAEKENGN